MYDLFSWAHNEPATDLGQFLIARGISYATVIMIEGIIKFPKVYMITCRDDNCRLLGRAYYDKFDVQLNSFRAWYSNDFNRNRLNEDDQIIIDCILRYPNSAYSQ